MHIGHDFGPGYGISLSLFDADAINFEQGDWELFSIKLQFKIFGLRVNVISLDIADTRASLGLLNCYLSAFWG